MHPADGFKVVKALIDAGQGVEDVAVRWGVSVPAPCREGGIPLDRLMALTLIAVFPNVDHGSGSQVRCSGRCLGRGRRLQPPGLQSPSSSPTAFRSSTRSHTALMTIRMGTARNRPHTPHSQPHASTPTKMATEFMRAARLASQGVST